MSAVPNLLRVNSPEATDSADTAAPPAPRRRRVGRPAGALPVTDRTRLLEAAERSIAEHGPSVSLETIALAAGVTKPVLYQYVGNKDALVEALATRHMMRMNRAAEKATGLAPGGRERVRGFIAAFFDIVDADRNLYLFLTSAASNAGSAQRSMSFADQSARPLAIVLSRQRVAAGADPSHATTWDYGPGGLLHYVTLWWLRESTLSLAEIVDHVTELMWGGLSGDTPAPTARPRPKRSTANRNPSTN